MTVERRSLTEQERTDLSRRLAQARTDLVAVPLRTAGASLLVCGILAVVTRLASDAPTAVIVGFWAAMALLFTVWIGGPARKLTRQQVPWLEAALDANQAQDTRITSARVVEFEEFEDEGACYAFEHESGSLFIVGQEFYEEDDFPNTDFSIVEILGPHGLPVDTYLDKHGSKLRPERVISAAVKAELELPEHLSVLPVTLDQLESELRRRGDRP